ncbi:acyl-CoA dehydrogenase family protein [Cytobacillus oceanisediminis]|uniref:Acyl-CoA dehydrogenase n=1 Tax=Cytobacillus oceanisediminis TaxID=665099 RepID=A0A562JRV6_9BACI|nr:acyl-CoA dehydrogenase family protein [Cytobacillus oceanisediminis]TWH85881.1 acyl-CoA dehydrogenase [Cytobacillus oceanisediminis]
MSEIRSMLEDTVSKVLKDLCTKELIIAAEKGEFPAMLWKTLEELGLTSVGISEERGGSGGDLGDFMTLVKTAGYYAAPVPLAENILSKIALEKSGLPISDQISTFSFENEIEFDKADSGWVLSGKAKYVPWARNARTITVLGKTFENKRMIANVSLENCEARHHENLAGDPRDEVLLNQVRLNDHEVKAIDNGMISEFINLAALTRVMLMAGALERTLELSVTYTKERTQFGRPIGKFQAVQQNLAVLAGETTASLAVADFIISNIDSTISAEEAAMAKIQLGDAAEAGSRIAHQVHGAMGFTDEHPLHQSTRRLWSWRDEFGSESMLARQLGERVLQQSQDLWGFITKIPGIKAKNI